MKKRHQQKLIVLTILLLALFNIPILLLFDVEYSIVGFPLIYFYIFVIWVLAIVITNIILRRFHE
jgi:hypothetical protein